MYTLNAAMHQYRLRTCVYVSDHIVSRRIKKTPLLQPNYPFTYRGLVEMPILQNVNLFSESTSVWWGVATAHGLQVGKSPGRGQSQWRAAGRRSAVLACTRQPHRRHKPSMAFSFPHNSPCFISVRLIVPRRVIRLSERHLPWHCFNHHLFKPFPKWVGYVHSYLNISFKTHLYLANAHTRFKYVLWALLKTRKS